MSEPNIQFLLLILVVVAPLVLIVREVRDHRWRRARNRDLAELEQGFRQLADLHEDDPMRLGIEIGKDYVISRYESLGQRLKDEAHRPKGTST